MILREARRFLKNSPLLSLCAVTILALGIGFSTFALAMLLTFSSLSSPGMRNAGYATIAEETEGGGSVSISWKTFESLRSSPGQDATFAAYSRQINTTLQINHRASPLKVAAISRGFFSVFTFPLRAGRDFSREEEDTAGTHVVILSLPLAIKLFRSPELAINHFLILAGQPYEVVGVAPSGFDGLFGNPVQAWAPASSVIPLEMQLPSSFARLASPDVWETIISFYGLATSGQSSSADLAAKLRQSLPLRQIRKATLHVSQGLTTDPVRDAKLRKWLRLGLLLALIFTVVGGVNYSFLLLARTPRFTDEVILRRALGAGSGRLMAELMAGPASTVIIALFFGTVLWVSGMALVSRTSLFYEQLVRGSWHAALLAFGIQVLFVCGLTLLIVLIPATELLRGERTPRLGYASTSSRRTGSFLQALVICQITLCIGTWILAGMVISAVTSLGREGLGYDPEHLAVICIGPTSGNVSFTTSSDQTFPELSAIKGLLGKVSALPGVRGVSFASSAPFDSPAGMIEIQRMDSASGGPRTVNDLSVSPGFFRALGSRIILGREFSWGDLTESSNQIVINEALAKELWPNVNPVNRSLRLIFPAFAGMRSFTSVATVVGVAENMRFSGYLESPEPAVFRSLKGTSLVTSYLIVRGTEPFNALQDMASRQVTAQLQQLSVQNVYNIRDRAHASLWHEKQRAYFALGGAFAMAFIAYIGLYAALTYYVNTRRRELAVRVCLGAQAWAIRKIILVRAARCAILATVISAPLWPVLAQLSSSDYLGQVSWSIGRALLLSIVCILFAIFISLIPAVAATRVSPSEVLKEL